MLLKNEFVLFKFHFKPKISSRKLFPCDSSKIRQKTVQKSLSQCKIRRKPHSDEEKSLLMQYHSINIEKLPKGIKKKFSNIAY